MLKKALFVFIIIGPIFFGACSTTTGPLFAEVPTENYKEKAKIYFYRNSECSSWNAFNFAINDDAPRPLLNEGYYLLVLEPGKYELRVMHDKSVVATNSFIFGAEEIYFVRFMVQCERLPVTPFIILPGGTPGYRPITNIVSESRDEALAGLKQSHLIEAPMKR